MDINEALSALRGAFPRVSWTGEPFAGSSIMIVGRYAHHPSVVVLGGDDEWRCDGAPGKCPVSAVRAWLAAQPTAAFYPEAQGGETVQIKGWVAFNDANDYAFAPDGGAGNEWESRQDAIDGLLHHGDPIVHAFTLRVPVPVEPPVLVGEGVP